MNCINSNDNNFSLPLSLSQYIYIYMHTHTHTECVYLGGSNSWSHILLKVKGGRQGYGVEFFFYWHFLLNKWDVTTKHKGNLIFSTHILEIEQQWDGQNRCTRIRK